MRIRTVLMLEAAAASAGGIGLVLLFRTSVGDHVFGWCGIAATMLAVLAMARRSWARLPLLGLALSGVWLASAAFSSHDDPSEIAGFAYLCLTVLIMLTASMSGAITIVEADLRRGVNNPESHAPTSTWIR